MLDEKLRPLKEAVLIPVSKQIGKVLSPNVMTFISFLLGTVSIVYILMGQYLLAGILWGLNRITDGLDGTIARVTGRQSDIGGYLDILADFVIYSLIPIAFVIDRGRINSELLVLSIMLAVYYINAASWMYLSTLLHKREKIEGQYTSVIMPLGVVEGFETIVFYTLFFIIPNRILALMTILLILTFLGTIQRIIWAIWKLR